jgi:Ca2+-binding RTX toxin-like protein
MARAKFWDQFNLSTVVLNDIWEGAQSRFSDLDDPFRFRGITYDDALVLYSTEPDGTKLWFEQYGNLVANANDSLTGNITAIATWFLEAGEDEEFYNSYISGFSVDVKTLTDAMKSPGTADDLAIFRQMFSKSDTIRLSAFDDDIFGWKGNDTIFGGRGDDSISGDSGKDRLLGEAGNDILSGGKGRDALDGGLGKDTLTGGASVDQFLFNQTSGRDTVTDFQDGFDRIVISTGAESLADLTITSGTGGVIVAFETVRILLSGEVMGSITAADFDFV